jgi:hypothetical protein
VSFQHYCGAQKITDKDEIQEKVQLSYCQWSAYQYNQNSLILAQMIINLSDSPSFFKKKL